MKKKSKAAAEPTLVFYKKVEWEQMAFRRRREEIMVAVSVLLLCVLTIFGWAAVGIGVMCGALHALYKEKKKAIPCSLRLSPSGICYWGARFVTFTWQEIQRFESFSWQEIQRIQLYCTHYGNRNMISLQICVKKDHAETERRALLFDDMEPLEEKYRLAQQWIAHYHPHTEYTESEKDG